MKPIDLTPQLCYAAGQDAGNRSMRRAGRARWNDDDWDAAAAEHERLTLVRLSVTDRERREASGQ